MRTVRLWPNGLIQDAGLVRIHLGTNIRLVLPASSPFLEPVDGKNPKVVLHTNYGLPSNSEDVMHIDFAVPSHLEHGDFTGDVVVCLKSSHPGPFWIQINDGMSLRATHS